MDYTGTLLIASPHLEDPNFRMSVVLIAHQTKKQVFGLVLNRMSSQRVGDLWKSIFDVDSDSDAPIYLGGPLPFPPMALLAKNRPNEFPSVKEVRLVVDKEEILRIAEEEGTESARIFIGCAGWTESQLAGEIKEGVWHLLPADEEDIFSDPSGIWMSALQKATRNSLKYLVRMPEFPDDPRLN